MTECDVPEARQTIQILTSVGRIKRRSLAFHPHERIFRVIRVVERVNQVGQIRFDYLFDIYSHDECSCYQSRS